MKSAISLFSLAIMAIWAGRAAAGPWCVEIAGPLEIETDLTFVRP